MAIRTSETNGDLMKALAAAQGKFGAAIKGNINPAFRSKYADLSAVIDATLEHLNKEGIVVMQHPALEYKGEGENREAYVTVTTRLQLGPEWIESDISIPAVQRDRYDAQSVGSAITYGCRYALQSILVVPREDDDGNQATGRGTSEAAQAVAQEKIAKAKGKTPQIASNAVPSLFYALQPSGQYAVQGDRELMKKLWQQFKANWSDNGQCYMVNEAQLEVLKFETEQAKIPFSVLKGPRADEEEKHTFVGDRKD